MYISEQVWTGTMCHENIRWLQCRSTFHHIIGSSAQAVETVAAQSRVWGGERSCSMLLAACAQLACSTLAAAAVILLLLLLLLLAARRDSRGPIAAAAAAVTGCAAADVVWC
jgi:hypothetical protein